MVPPQGNFPGLFQNQLRGGCSAGRASEPGERALETARRVSGLVGRALMPTERGLEPAERALEAL